MGSERQECCRILGLEMDASVVQVRKRFRLLAKQLHPDCCGGNEQQRQVAEEGLKKIVHAYRTLMADRLAESDRLRGNGLPAGLRSVRGLFRRDQTRHVRPAWPNLLGLMFIIVWLSVPAGGWERIPGGWLPLAILLGLAAIFNLSLSVSRGLASAYALVAAGCTLLALLTGVAGRDSASFATNNREERSSETAPHGGGMIAGGSLLYYGQSLPEEVGGGADSLSGRRVPLAPYAPKAPAAPVVPAAPVAPVVMPAR